LHHYINEENNPNQARHLLIQHNQNSRSKVQLFKNGLRELKELLKKRNIFRLSKANRFSCKLNSDKEGGKSIKKEFSKTNYEPSQELAHRKNDRDHSAFSTMKGEKLLEIYQEGKVRTGGGDEALSYLKRYLGVGLENTPFYGWAERKKIAEKNVHKSKPKYIASEEKRPNFRLQDHLKREVDLKKEIYLSFGNQKKEGNFPHNSRILAKIEANNAL
jgi:hypothetical protein